MMTRQGDAATMLLVNGRECRVLAGNLAELLVELGYGDARVATAVDGRFVPEGMRAVTKLAGGERIEIVGARQGG